MFGRKTRELRDALRKLEEENATLRSDLEDEREKLIRKAYRKRFVVTLHDDTTFDGLLIEADSEVVILQNATVITDPREVPQPVDGKVYLERSKIAYMQAPRR